MTRRRSSEAGSAGRRRQLIQGLWIGGRLSRLERLSIRSFLAHGHDYHLYAYGAVEGVPAGATVRSARRILPPERIFRFGGDGSYAAFSNLFRWELLHRRGGWWADLDVVCLRPFDFRRPHVFAAQSNATYRAERVTSCVVKAPSGSAAIGEARRAAAAVDPETLAWGQLGPDLLDRVVAGAGLRGSVEPYRTFCPVFYDDVPLLLDPGSRFARLAEEDPGPHAIHLWNEIWSRLGLDKDAAHPDGCLYERLEARYP